MLVIILHDSIDGVTVHGPFKTQEEVDDYIDEFCGGADDWEVHSLIKNKY